MLGAAIIVFRESLEAALLVGIVAAAARTLPHRNRWVAGGIFAGILGSVAVAMAAGTIAEMADGMGQEVLNAIVLGLAVTMLGWHNIWMSRHAREMVSDAKNVVREVAEGSRELSAIAVVIAMAVLREGSETVLFLFGLMSQDQSLGQVLSGGALGLVAGVLLGLSMYAGLLRVPVRWFFTVTAGLVLLLAAGMAGQMAHFLIQGDLLPALADPLWDTSAWLSATSAAGILLHVLAGYDPRPSAMQAIFYLGTIALIAVGMYLVRSPATGNGRPATT
ncbi:MAG TPA: FTR1 family protein [Aromatoleum sp.]|uniref:FTR1 family iron permease n=1 Tax=Aromatoleum sp. TaxID=2307007 RepID=UPI002B494D2C|nr:FTR1 family protein [Aromatoleum sp.]HJV28025.1 FTR1 family protein [Aromatoleum sp.]